MTLNLKLNSFITHICQLSNLSICLHFLSCYSVPSTISFPSLLYAHAFIFPSLHLLPQFPLVCAFSSETAIPHDECRSHNSGRERLHYCKWNLNAVCQVSGTTLSDSSHNSQNPLPFSRNTEVRVHHHPGERRSKRQKAAHLQKGEPDPLVLQVTVTREAEWGGLMILLAK